jgi:hypothetical protein
MDNNLQNYIKQKIEQLTTTFNLNLLSLRNILVTNIKKINKMNILIYIKIQHFNALKKTYNNSIAKLTKQYKKNKNYILSLTTIPTNKYSLLIGINYIGTSNELFGCINDTNNIKHMLQDKFSYNNFIFLTDKTNKKPTKNNIINELTNLLVRSNTGDSLFFLYSGHGTYTVDINNDELDRQDEIIVPLDGTTINTCISDDMLNQIIQNNLKEGVKLFMLFDCCFSGTIIDLKYNYLDSDNFNNTTINPNVSETVSQVVMISGCKDTQTSDDAIVNYNNKVINSGAMSFSFLKSIQDHGINISLKKLLLNMRTILHQNGYSQVPQLSSGTPIDIDNVLISSF